MHVVLWKGCIKTKQKIDAHELLVFKTFLFSRALFSKQPRSQGRSNKMNEYILLGRDRKLPWRVSLARNWTAVPLYFDTMDALKTAQKATEADLRGNGLSSGVYNYTEAVFPPTPEITSRINDFLRGSGLYRLSKRRWKGIYQR